MSGEGSLFVEQVSKRFRADRHRALLRDHVARLTDAVRGQPNEKAWRYVLRDVTFSVQPGEAVALVGTNGSGKSTMLKILAGVMFPYAGQVQHRGRVGAMIEVAAGIHPELSGRENVSLYGALLGLDRATIARRFDEIVQFAGLEAAIDRPVKFYSSGMKMRLGFAINAYLEPDILIVDEVLAVGDAEFQRRCLERMSAVVSQGTTLIYVSHDLPTVEAMCDRALWLSEGELRADGPTRQVLADYQRATERLGTSHLFTECGLRCLEFRVAASNSIVRSGAATRLELDLESVEDSKVRVVIGISDSSPNPVFTLQNLQPITAGTSTVSIDVESIPLPGGSYSVWATFLTENETPLIPWHVVGHISVEGPMLESLPTGIVRQVPVLIGASWSAKGRS